MFRVFIKENGNVYTMEGSGEYPKNYFEFKNWIGDVSARDIL